MIDLVLSQRQPWRERAACAQTDPDLFFPESYNLTNQVRDAQAICEGCPVILQCRSWVLGLPDAEDSHGIAGGLTPRDRRKLREARRKAIA